MKKFAISLVTLMVALSSATAATRTAVFAWAPNPEPDVAGYIFYERLGEDYLALGAIEASPSPTYTVSNLTRGTHYYSVTAYNTEGLESDFSDEVAYHAGRVH